MQKEQQDAKEELMKLIGFEPAVISIADISNPSHRLMLNDWIQFSHDIVNFKFFLNI